MKKRLFSNAILGSFVFCVLTFFSISALAQDEKLMGQVVDEQTGEPIEGATIRLGDAGVSVLTSVGGQFVIDDTGKDTVLTVTYVGYESKKISIPTEQHLRITLQPVATNLEDVVVVGYGTVKKRDLTGSVVSIKGAETTKVPASNPVEALQGKIAGADIARTNGYAGATPNIRIRGTRSIANPSSSNNVLYIIDGIQYANMADVNPNDIQSFEVLKDASSTAIYGSRGANGVIIITTKKGSVGTTAISFNGYTGVTQSSKYGKVQNGEQYIAFKREAYRAAGKWNSIADDEHVFNPQERKAIENKEYVNWPDLIMHKGLQQDYNINVSAGNDKTKLYFSAGYFDEKGILKNDRFKRYSTRLNLEQSLNSWLKAGTNVSYAFTDNDMRRDPFNLAFKAIPLGIPYDEQGNVVVYPVGGTERSPLLDDQPGEWYSNRKTNRFSGAFYLNFSLAKDLTLRSTFSTVQESYAGGTYYGKNSINGNGSTARGAIANAQNNNISWENVLTYQKTVGNHDLTLTGISAYQQAITTTSTLTSDNQTFPSQLVYNLRSGINPTVASNFVKWNLLSFAGRINYSYKGKYLITMTGRGDGSSKLGPGNKWGFFSSISGAWRISDEPFMVDQMLFTDLKLRAGYGVSGNDVISPYGTQSGLTSTNFAHGNQQAIAYTINPLIGNPDLRWEKTKTLDIGLDFSLLSNRLSGSVGYYDALTYDLISSYVLPPSTGVSTINRNFGETRNRGVEVSITGQILRDNPFRWESTLTFARNREKIVELPNGNVIDADYRKSLIVGQSPTIFYDYVKTGIWQLGEEDLAASFGAIPGDVKIADLNGDGKLTTDDRTIIGSAVPDWTGGWNNDFSYKGFDLNVLLIARVGQWMSSDYYAKYYRNASQNGAPFNYWTPENPSDEYPRPNVTRSMNYITTLTEKENSYLKLRNITLGYSFSTRLLDHLKISKARLYMSGKNLWFYSKNNPDFDPESEGVVDQPLNKMVVMGLNITF